MDNTNPFRPLVEQKPGEPHPESQDYADMIAEQAEHLAYAVHSDRYETGGDEIEFADESDNY